MEAYNPLYTDQNGKQVIVAAKIIVYAGSPDKYYSFLTPEAYYALKQWMDYRASDGEVISGESWIMWDLWRTTNVKHGANRSLATNPRQLKASAIKKLLQRALWALNLRPVLPKGERRHEWKSSHGYRKYFKSRAEQIMRPLHVELLMGHSVGVSDSYARPTEQEMLQDYIRGVDYLTVNTDQKTTIQLQKQVSELKEEREQNNYTIMGRLAEKDKQIADLQKEQQNIFEFFKTNMQIMVRNTIAQELDETTKKENPGIKKLIQRGNYAIHWGTARREEEENNPSGSWGS